jgi:hypothetical protein
MPTWLWWLLAFLLLAGLSLAALLLGLIYIYLIRQTSQLPPD